MKENTAEKIRKKIKTFGSLIFVGILTLVLIFNSVYTINEQEKGVVLTFGKPTTVVNSGLNFKIPFIQSVEKVNTTIRGFAIGYDENNNYTNDAVMITNDFNFVNVDFFVEWRITDPIKALYAAENPVDILSKTVQSSARAVIGNDSIDSILTTGKNEIQAKIKEGVAETLDKLDIGIQIHSITIQDAEPPTAEIMAAFNAVEDAKQQKDTFVNDANKYKNEQLPAAEAKADKYLQEAEAQKQARINEANGQVARFNAMFEEYIKNPEITKLRLFYEAMEEIMPGLEVVIENTDGSTSKVYPVKPFTNGGSTNEN